jgi:hypothetical protein
MLLLLMLTMLAGQQTGSTATAPAATPQRWSILVDPCTGARPDEILVCGKGEQSQRLPLPEERGPPDRPMPSNPDMSGAGALAAASAPCATRSEGCTTGVDLFGGGTFLVRAIGKVIDPNSCCEEPGEATNPVKLVSDAGKGIGRMFKKKPDKSNRVPIPLEDPAPAPRAPLPAEIDRPSAP